LRYFTAGAEPTAEIGDLRRPGDPSILVADATRARHLLSWSAERSDLATSTNAWRWHKGRFRGRKP
jgi:UDP-glucose 4-epimerase